MIKKISKLIKWEVSPPETGRYRSFHKRGWPTCLYKDGNENLCAMVLCKDEYIPRDVKVGKHVELTVRIRDHSEPTFKTVTVKRKFATLKEAKAVVPKVLAQHPEFMPAHIREKVLGIKSKEEVENDL